MKKHRVEFDAHKVVKAPAKVSFTTTDGERVRFAARKETRIPVRVKFTAKNQK